MTKPLEDGCLYEGEWKEGKPEGSGKAKWPDGWVFEGKFVDGKPHGGDLRSPNMLIEAGSDSSTINKRPSGNFSYDCNSKDLS